MYVPINQTLGFILSTSGIDKVQLFEKFPVQDKSIYESIFDGSVFKNGQLFKCCKHVILASLYYDEFEVVNPLGSKVKKHKLGAFYLTIFNLPDYLNSTFIHTHLVALFKTSDMIGGASLNNILEPLVIDLKILESRGIEVNNQIYKVSIGSIRGDNLGINKLLQMVKSFRAENYCNICEIDSKTAKFSTEEDPKLLRNPETYNKIIQEGIPLNKVHNKGIKGYCILNDLNFFHVCTNYTGDIMHDLLEGSLPASVKLFLKHLIGLRLITLEEVNERIYQFNYGLIDYKNKPSSINLSKEGCLIGERAAQNWCLARYLPLILGDLVKLKEVQDEWKVVTSLLDIVDIVFSPRITKKSLDDLRKLTKTYCSIKISVNDRAKIPKDHFIEHYATIIERMGPLYFLWSMRYEAKHNFFKDIMNKYHNFNSVAQTLAEQHQRFMYNKWRLNTDVFTLLLEYTGKKITSLFSILIKYGLPRDAVQDMPVISVCGGLKYGHKYRPGFFVLQNVEQDIPTFYRILEIFIVKNIPYCLGEQFRTLEFDSSFHAYRIEKCNPENLEILNLSNLMHKIPYEQHQAHNNFRDYFIVLRYKF